MKLIARALCFAAAACALTGCGASQERSWSKPDLSADTVQDIMKTKVDAAADSLWDSVATIDTAAGEEVRQPRTDAEWTALAQQAQLLIDGATLLETPRLVSAPGRDLDDATTPGARTAVQVQQDIAKHAQKFSQDAKLLQASGRKTLAAIKDKNLTALLSATEELDAVCETCHEAFWYPHTPPARFPPERELAKTENRP